MGTKQFLKSDKNSVITAYFEFSAAEHWMSGEKILLDVPTTAFCHNFSFP